MQNMPSLSDLDQLAPSEIANLPIDQLCALFEENKEIEAGVKRSKALLTDAVIRKFQDEIDAKESGVINLSADGITLKVVKKKYADWDQDKLIEVEQAIRDKWGRNPDEYIKTKRSVAEASYKAWPADLQAVFTPARTTKISAPSIDTFTSTSE